MSDAFINDGRDLLDRAWAIALETSGLHYYDARLASACDMVFAGAESGYQKAIVIQATGKAANPMLDAHALQKGIGSNRSWDAREFAKQVFVPWNQRAGCPFSHAADPYVSNPYRIPRFDASVRAQRQRPMEFDAALAVLDELDLTTDKLVAFENLVEVVYALRRFIADRSVDYPLPNRASLEEVTACTEAFVAQRSGGARLQAVVYALFSALRSGGMTYADISSRHVNAADTSSGVAGDISFRFDGSRAAIEVKDRALSRAELEASIDKCRIAGVRELIFVIRADAPGADDLSEQTFAAESKRQFSSGLNIYLERFEPFTRTVLALLGEQGRRRFWKASAARLLSKTRTSRISGRGQDWSSLYEIS